MSDSRLFGDTVVPVAVFDPIQSRFEAFHAEHPEVMRALVKLAYQARAAGKTRVGMKMLFEVVRWERIIAGLPDKAEGFKLNNNYTSRYARLIMEEHSRLDGMFEVRGLRS